MDFYFARAANGVRPRVTRRRWPAKTPAHPRRTVERVSCDHRRSRSSTNPRAGVGVGFKAEHFDAIVEARPNLGFFEIHAENYIGGGGPPHRRLEAIRERYSLSLRGVWQSIGSPGPLDRAHPYPDGWANFHLPWAAMALAIMVFGPGSLSLDRALGLDGQIPRQGVALR